MTDKRELQKREAELEKGVERTRETRVYAPAVDIIEKNNDIVILADMPGVDENSVDITLEKDLLTIYGKVEPEIPENHRLVVSEYEIGDYQRTFTLSDEIDREHIRATVKDGVLKLVLPKAERAKTKKIPVTGNA
ncbi:MAG TPA: Hsp20/alpha crystallin family protein [Nitrospirae bacterium]|nr:18 kDa heat shock protein [bacterium BMS3Abin06]HDH12951.1 Hsp20/alpha crystallin family protein [Nitrospirota bacterium]HDZ00439.1 Hsp20/alpha crystallin family protein [Nitrospirota bacterium]